MVTMVLWVCSYSQVIEFWHLHMFSFCLASHTSIKSFRKVQAQSCPAGALLRLPGPNGSICRAALLSGGSEGAFASKFVGVAHRTGPVRRSQGRGPHFLAVCWPEALLSFWKPHVPGRRPPSSIFHATPAGRARLLL